MSSKLYGSGAIAQFRSVAGGAGSVVAGRDLHIHHVNHREPGAGEAALCQAYLFHLFHQTETLALSGIDPALASDKDARLRLDAVYTALLTNTVEERRRTEPPERKRLSALALLDRH